MNNKPKINTSKGKMYLTIAAIASLLMMAFSVNTNSLNVNAIDFGLISKDTNIGSIDTESLFNCVGAAITCDNDNTVNNNVAINNGTNGPVDSACETCLESLNAEQLAEFKAALSLGSTATLAETCERFDTTINNPDQYEYLYYYLISQDAFTQEEVIDLFECLGIPIPPP